MDENTEQRNRSTQETPLEAGEEYRSIPPSKLAQICRRYENELSQVKDWMFWFLMLWTTIILLMEWAEFLFSWAVPHAMQAGYIVLLGGYIAHKEVLRWMDVSLKERKGEVFVYIWWGTLLVMYIASYISMRWQVPDSITVLCYEVLGYLIFTEVSKALNTWRDMRKN